ncbi:MAG: hypothetical protein ACP5FL_06260 [Thermoplasmatota archaeon]
MRKKLLIIGLVAGLLVTSFIITDPGFADVENTSETYTLTVKIGSVMAIDSLEGLGDAPELYYKVSVYDGSWNSTNNIDVTDGKWYDNIHHFTVSSIEVHIEIKVMEDDVWTGDDLADVSSYPGGGADDDTSWRRGAIYTGYYNLENKSLWGDRTLDLYVSQAEEYYKYTSGEMMPDEVCVHVGAMPAVAYDGALFIQHDLAVNFFHSVSSVSSSPQ